VTKRLLQALETFFILLCGGLMLEFIEFTFKHRRLPVGAGEVWNWLMGLSA